MKCSIVESAFGRSSHESSQKLKIANLNSNHLMANTRIVLVDSLSMSPIREVQENAVQLEFS